MPPPPPPPPPPPVHVAPGAVIDWDSQRDGQERTYLSGPYRLRVSAARNPDGIDRGWTPAVEVFAEQVADTVPTLPLAAVSGVQEKALLRVAVARLDPSSPEYSVLLSSFTGGAHCCDDVQIATPSRAASVKAGRLGWTVLRPGAFDGAQLGFGPRGARLPAGADGTFGVSIPDDAFGYAFDCFACSFQPLRIYGLHAGALVERTAEPAFSTLLEADMRTAEAGCRAHGKGVCPGYLADAARLGRWGPAWKVVTASVLAHGGRLPGQALRWRARRDRMPPRRGLSAYTYLRRGSQAIPGAAWLPGPGRVSVSSRRQLAWAITASLGSRST